MYYFEYAEKDTTLYQGEATQSVNTGLDEILEIRKDMNSAGPVVNVSRALIKFDLGYISASIQRGLIPSSANYYLNLYDANPQELATSQSLYAYPVSQSWVMGQGTYSDDPFTKEGASWRYRDGEGVATQWVSGSNDSGGTWYSGSGYEASQSLNIDTIDIRMKVSDIVNKWLSGTVANEGFMVKRSGSIGNTDSNAPEGSTDKLGHLSFFSRDTHTIYPPKLEVEWDDSSWSTGSLTPLTGSDLQDAVIYMKGLRQEYKEDTKHRFNFVGRTRFPIKTYSTTSQNLTVKYLQSGSTTDIDGTYYSIRDAFTEDVIVPFGTGSIVSCDSNGNYFNLWLSSFQPERDYRILFKVVSGSNTTDELDMIFDDSWEFKVKR